MISRYDITLKVLAHSKNVKEYLFWNGQDIHQTWIPEGNTWNIMQNETGNQILCKKKIFGSNYVKRGVV